MGKQSTTLKETEKEENQESTTPSPSDTSKDKSDTIVAELETTRSSSRLQATYRPFAHRALPLVFLLVIVLGLIGMLEYAVRVLPSAQLSDGNQASSIPSVTAGPSPTATLAVGGPDPSLYASNTVASYTFEGPEMAAISEIPAPKSTGDGPKTPVTTMYTDKPLTLAKDGNLFLGTYLPILVAVVLRLLVTPLYRFTRLVDPFDQLSGPDGASFRDFFVAHHLGAESMRAPYTAFQRRRWNLFWTSTLYAAVQALTPIASELTKILPSVYIHGNPDFVYDFVVGQAIWIDSVIVRVAQALLGFICVLIITAWIVLWRSKPSLPANPASIATMASLVGHPETSRDFAKVDQTAEMRITMSRFRNRRYRLESYTGPDGSECYGIVPKEGKIRPPPKNPPTTVHRHKVQPFGIFWLPKIPWPRALTPSTIIQQDLINLSFISIGAITLFGLVLSYYLNHAETPFEKFMDSQRFGPRFVLSLLALCLKSPLRRLWLSITAALPWARLARSEGATARDVIEPVPIALTPLGAVAYSIRRREWFGAGLGVAAGLLAEVLIVLLPGVPYNPQQIYAVALVSWFGCIGCLSLIMLIAIIGWLRLATKTGRAKWPRPPVTIGAVATYVAGSTMATDFAANLTTAPSNDVRYRFGHKDGQWSVDYVNDTIE